MAVSENLLMKIEVDGKQAELSISNLSKLSDVLGSNFNRLQSTIISLNNAFSLFQTTINSLKRPIEAMTTAFLEKEDVITRLDQVLRSLGDTTGETTKYFVEFAKRMRYLTSESDVAILNLITMSKSMGLNNRITEEIVKATLNLAAVTGKDLNTAYFQLIGTFGGVLGLLARTVPQLKQLSATELLAGKAVEVINKEFADLAEKRAKTIKGALSIIINTFYNMSYEIINLVTNFFKIRDILQKIVDIFLSFEKIIQRINLSSLAESVKNVAIGFAALFSIINFPILVSLAAVIGLVAAKVTLVTAGIVGLSIAFDALFKNLDNLVGLFKYFGLMLATSFLEIVIKVVEWFTKLFSFMEKFIKVSSIKKFFQDINTELNGMADNLAKNANEISAGLKLPSLSGFLNDIEKSNENMKDLSKGIMDFNISTAEQRKTFLEIEGRIKDVEAQIFKLQNSGLTLLDFEIKNELEKLEIYRQQLAIQGGLNKEIEKRIDVLKERTKTLIEIQYSKAALQQINQNSKVAGFVVSQISKLSSYFGAQFQTSVEFFIARYEKLITYIGIGVEAAYQVIKTLLSPQTYIKIGDFLVSIVKEFLVGLPNAIEYLISKIDEFLFTFIDVLDGFVMRLPKVFEKLLTKLPDLVKALGVVLIEVVKTLPELFKDLAAHLPDILKGLFDVLPEFIKRFLMSLGEITKYVMRGIMQAIPALIEAIPDIVVAFVEGVINALPDIIEAFTVEIIRAIPKIAVALVKAIIRLITLPFQRIFGSIKIQVPKELKDVPKKLENALKRIGTAAEQMFKVLDLEEAGKAVRETLQVEINTKPIEIVLDRGKTFFIWVYEKLKELWDFITNILKAIGSIIWAIAEPLFNLLGTFFTRLWETLSQFFKDVGGFIDILLAKIVQVFSNLFDFVKEAFSGLFNFINETINNLFNFIGEAINNLSNIFSFIKINVFDPFVNALSSVGNFLKGVFEGFTSGLKKIFSGIGDVLKNAFDNFFGWLSNLSFPNLLEKLFPSSIPPSKGTIEHIISKAAGISFDIPFVKFSEGGIVKGTALLSGDSKINDRIPALLSAGEIVIPRSQAQYFAWGGSVGEFFKSAGEAIGEGIKSIGEATGINKVIEAGAQFINYLLDPVIAIVRQYLKQIFNAVANMFTNHLGKGLLYNGGNIFISSGEYVVSRSAVDYWGTGFLDAINSKMFPTIQQQPTNQTYSFNININIEADSVDENTIRDKVIPAIKRELKASSARGEFIISSRGIRNI